VRQRGKAAAFRVGEPQPPVAELGFEHPIFLRAGCKFYKLA
jgi:hypothetical protein